MKQLTPEINARVFALYFGQSVGLMFMPPHIHMAGKPLTVYGPQFNALVEKGYSSCLEVKPLSSITDEDAAELNAMHNWTKGVHGTKHWYQDEADFLRSKGYALPAFGYSVDELVEAGVFKIKEVNND